jgi:SlyX protein
MPDENARLTEIETALAHQERFCEELHEVVREQAGRVARLEREIAVLNERLAALEAGAGTAPPPDVRPPHW